MGSEICFGNNLVLDYRKLSIDIIYLYYICFIVHQLLPIFLSHLIIKLESNAPKKDFLASTKAQSPQLSRSYTEWYICYN